MELFYQNTVQKASSFAWNFRNQRLHCHQLRLSPMLSDISFYALTSGLHSASQSVDPGGNSDAGLTLSAAGRIVDTLKAAIEAMLLFP